MPAKDIKRIESNARLMAKLAEAIKTAHEDGLSADDVRTTLERFTELLTEE